jgi:hypothetical protein
MSWNKLSNMAVNFYEVNVHLKLNVTGEHQDEILWPDKPTCKSSKTLGLLLTAYTAIKIVIRKCGVKIQQNGCKTDDYHNSLPIPPIIIIDFNNAEK